MLSANSYSLQLQHSAGPFEDVEDVMRPIVTFVEILDEQDTRNMYEIVVEYLG